MTDQDVPLLVLVHGPPGSGKTTIASALAEELGLPLVEKDQLKEALYESLGIGDTRWSRRLGGAAYDLLYLVAARFLEAGVSVVLEGNFVAGEAEGRLGELPAARIVQLHCDAAEGVLLDRYRRRDRHPGHLDSARLDDVRTSIRSGCHRPLALDGTLIELDTSTTVDVTTVAAAIAAADAPG